MIPLTRNINMRAVIDWHDSITSVGRLLEEDDGNVEETVAVVVNFAGGSLEVGVSGESVVGTVSTAETGVGSTATGRNSSINTSTKSSD